MKAPMTCSRGGSDDNAFSSVVTMPTSLATGSTFTIRVDGMPSGTISHFGLNYVFGMDTKFLVPAGTTYVDGSAHIVPGTGTANVRAGARVFHDATSIHLVLPARVANGSGYTQPSMEFAVRINAPAGTDVGLKFAHYEIMANAAILGDVHTACDPNPNPFNLATLHVVPEAEAAR